MKILVTGGAGFLGSHLTKTLVELGHDVDVLDLVENPKYKTIVGDVGDAQVVAKAVAGKDVVFHLAGLIQAGESVAEPYKYAQTNVLGAVVLLEEMRKANVKKFIFSSSAAVYGDPIQVPIFEDDRTIPINPYGTTKLALEGLASSYSYAHGFTCVALRYFNLYGPGENHVPETHAIPRFVKQINSGEVVTVWGNGEHKRDFVYVLDIVDAHIKALAISDGTYHYYNCSGKNATSVNEMVTEIESILGKKANIRHFDPRPGDPLLLFADGGKAKRELGWESTTELRTGLQTTIDWMRSSGRI